MLSADGGIVAGVLDHRAGRIGAAWRTGNSSFQLQRAEAIFAHFSLGAQTRYFQLFLHFGLLKSQLGNIPTKKISWINLVKYTGSVSSLLQVPDSKILGCEAGLAAAGWSLRLIQDLYRPTRGTGPSAGDGPRHVPDDSSLVL